MLRTQSVCLALVLVLALTLAAAGPVGAIPVAPHQFYGEVTINGSPALNGTTVSAHIGTLSWSTTTSDGSYGYDPMFEIDADDPATPEKDGGTDGDTIVFKVDGTVAATYPFQSRTRTGLDLAVQTCTLTMAVSGSGSTEPAVGVHTYATGTTVNITATPDAGWEFDSWSGDVGALDDPESAATTVTMDSDTTVTANFAEIPVANYTLTMAVSGSGSTNPAVGNHTYAPATVVAISADPNPGWAFDSWSGDLSGSDNPDTITMDSNKSITANFAEMPVANYTLTMAVSGSGSTNPAVGNHTYAPATVVAITANPDPGWGFHSWTCDVGDVDDPDSATTTVTMDSDRTVTANFAEIPPTQYTLTIAVSGSGSTNPAVGVHTYAPATVVAITADPDPGWFFDSWTCDVGDVADPESATTTVTMDSDRTVTANFAEIPPTPVGGSAHSPNKVAVLAPWIGLGVVLAGSITWLMLRRLRLNA